MKLELEAQAIAELNYWQPAGGGTQHADDAKSEDSADDIPPDAAAYFGAALAQPAEVPVAGLPVSPKAASPSTPGARRSAKPEDFSWTDPTAIAAAHDEILQLKSQLRNKDKAIAQLEEAVLAATPASGTTFA